MRILIFADLHANWEALAALVAAMPRRPDAILFLGDAVGFGPDPARCVGWLRQYLTTGVRGDHDQALLDFESGPQDEQSRMQELADEAQATLRHARSMLGEADRAFLAGLPLTATVALDGARFFLAHGTPVDPLHGQVDLLLQEARVRELVSDLDADVVLFGHTHVPALRQVGRTLVVNPGSLGQPRQGMPDGTFAFWEDGRVQIHHLHYPHDYTAEKLALLPLSGEQRHRLQHVLATGRVPEAGDA